MRITLKNKVSQRESRLFVPASGQLTAAQVRRARKSLLVVGLEGSGVLGEFPRVQFPPEHGGLVPYLTEETPDGGARLVAVNSEEATT